MNTDSRPHAAKDYNAYPTGLAGEINLCLLPLAALLWYHAHVGLLRHGLRRCLFLHSRQGMMRIYRLWLCHRYVGGG